MRFPLPAFLVLALSLSTPAAAGTDWKAMIGAESVAIADGKMRIEEYQLCKVNVPGAAKTSMQIRSYTEAPLNAGISRDFVVSFSAITQTVMVMTFGAAAATGTDIEPLKALSCDAITAPIGKVDLEVNLYMTGEGFQLEVVADGQSNRQSSRWEDTFDGK